MSHSIDRSRYLSPPVSPQPKQGLQLFTPSADSSAETSLTNDDGSVDNGPLMYILPADTNVKRYKRFLAAYGFKLGDNKKVNKPNKKPKQQPASSSSSSSASSDEIDKELLLSREYLTRSKRPRSSSDESEDLKKKSTKFETSDVRNFKSNEEFLEESTVQDVHGFAVDEIPNFEPDFNKIEFKKILKKFGYDNSNILKHDEGLELISENEIPIVIFLKISPLQYFDTKKRLFAEKARKTFNSSTFKKTDAQKACRIDVNKASKLYEIFQNAGLLNDDLF